MAALVIMGLQRPPTCHLTTLADKLKLPRLKEMACLLLAANWDTSLATMF